MPDPKPRFSLIWYIPKISVLVVCSLVLIPPLLLIPNVNPAVFRKVYGINGVGEEYVGCLSNILDSIDFYKRNLEVALDKIHKLEYDLKQYKENTDGTA